MLEGLTLDTLAPLVGQTFRLHLDDGTTIDMVLESAAENATPAWRPADDAPERRPFTLTFVGPPELVLPQRIYRFEHETLGNAEIFIVPVGRTARGVTYEAVFS
jgi:hypothetical protein